MYKLVVSLALLGFTNALLESHSLRSWKSSIAPSVLDGLAQGIKRDLLPSYDDGSVKSLLSGFTNELEARFERELRDASSQSSLYPHCIDSISSDECAEETYTEAVYNTLSSRRSHESFESIDIIVHHALALESIPAHVRSSRHPRPLRRRAGLDSLAALPDTLDLPSVLPRSKRAHQNVNDIKLTLAKIVGSAQRKALKDACGSSSSCKLNSKRPVVSIV